MISGAHTHTHTLTHTAHAHIHTHTPQQPKGAYRALLLKWSKLPGVKERLLLKKDREQRGREKEGEAPRIEEFSEGKAERVTVGLWEVALSCRGPAGVCVSASLQQWTQEEEEHVPQESPPEQSDQDPRETCDKAPAAERAFIFPHTRSHPPLIPSMPTLPEEEEDSPEDLDSSSSSPSTSVPCEIRAVVMAAPTIVYPQQATIVQQDGRPMEQARPHSPRARLSRNSSGGPITTVDSTGNVIDLVKDALPELQLSEDDRQKNLELLEQAKKVSDRFLTRRGRRSTGSTDSPTGLSPTLTPSSSPCSSRSSSLTVAPQAAAGPSESTQSVGQLLEVPSGREQTEPTTQDQGRMLVDWKPTEKRKVSSGTLTPRFAVQKENCDPTGPKSPPAVNKADEGAGSGQSPNQAPATGVAKPVLRPPTQLAPCTAEIKTIGAFPPLMRAVSWDAVGSLNSRNGAPSFPPKAEDTFSDKPRDVLKSSGYKDLPAPPGGVPKLSKLREEHKLLRNHSIVGSKLPDLSEAAEQEKGPHPTPIPASSAEAKEKLDAMPNISDVMLRKLKLHRGLPGCAPPLTEKEVENAFVQLSLAFRNDNYTLETRLKQAERERNMTEEDTEKELEEFKGALKTTSPQCQNLEQREAYQRLTETVSVLHRLATRLSSRAEIVGAVRQEKRMNKATEVMMQYVENLKRTYEKDHAELTEFKKLANQNSNRCYSGSVDTGDDGVARSSRSMSLTLGKALPRRRVSVAVVPKFNLLNIPGQSPATAGPGPNLLLGPSPSSGPHPALGPNVGPSTGAALPVLCEANDVKVSTPREAVQPAAECGKSVLEQESEPAKPSVNLEEIRAELKAKIEEEAYNKGLQEGLKQNKVHQDEKHEEENTAEKLLESTNKDEESGRKINTNRRMEEVLARLSRYCPKISLNRRLLWMALTLFVVMCLVISIFSFFSHYYNKREDT
ncbi:inositol 1,4,5-triphosphate receptor associated 1 isoform X1 [Pleuronectes platessa]|nr:inositol 1,4,5-triphosphate receptor associated 1 isoform X1 [Pleuronectes platessa]